MASHDFDYRILDEVGHRPWPMPHGPWIMTQTWHDLLFAHWPIDEILLASKIPQGLEIDLHQGEAWLGIVPFHMTNVAPRAAPIVPRVSEFPELNVRTYVRAGAKPGVYFFSLDAGNRVAVAVARAIFHLPYYLAAMRVDRHGDSIHFSSTRLTKGSAVAQIALSYQPVGPRFTPREGTLEHFLTERYCLYTVDRRGRLLRLDIHHPPWTLQPAGAAFQVNTMADAAGLRLPGRSPQLHFSKRQDMVAWPLTRLDAS
jgi:uncharacterized protein YqjF (DUF2071 family)